MSVKYPSHWAGAGGKLLFPSTCLSASIQAHVHSFPSLHPAPRAHSPRRPSHQASVDSLASNTINNDNT